MLIKSDKLFREKNIMTLFKCIIHTEMYYKFIKLQHGYTNFM